jgi:phosphate:Na+ symporter
MTTSAHKRINEGVNISVQTADAIGQFYSKVVTALAGALEAVAKEDSEIARNVRAMKDDIGQMGREIALHGIERLGADAPKRLETYAREMELIEILDGVFKIARRIARSQLKEEPTAVEVAVGAG